MPDATMVQHSEANNTRLLTVYPKGFALDAAHRPHITMFQCFVRLADLDKVFSAANEVLAGADVTGMKLEGFEYYYIPSKDIGLAGIVVKRTPKLLKLQAGLMATLAPFTVATGDSGGFVTTPDDPIIDPQMIEYVSTLFRRPPVIISVRMSPQVLPFVTISTCYWPNRLHPSSFLPLVRPSIS